MFSLNIYSKFVLKLGELIGGVTSVAFSQLVSDLIDMKIVGRIVAKVGTIFHFYFAQQNGGNYILATDASADSILSVWQWQWGHLLGKVAVSILSLFPLNCPISSIILGKIRFYSNFLFGN